MATNSTINSGSSAGVIEEAAIGNEIDIDCESNPRMVDAVVDRDVPAGDDTIELGTIRDVTTIKISSADKVNDVHDDGMTIAGTDISDGITNLPEFLICPIKRELLKDPVVLQDGFSYERDAVEGRKPEEPIIYPNRALLSILTELQSHPAVAAARSSGTSDGNSNINVTAKSFIPKQSLLQQAKIFLTAKEDRPLPQALYCPITLGIMHEPVIDPSGVSYEKVAIVNWIRVNGDSPVTRMTLTVDELVPNRAIAQLLQMEVDREDADDIHPVLLKWKNEPVPYLLPQPQADVTAPVHNSNESQIASSSTSGAAAASMPFPTTRDELEAQMEQARRQRQNRIKCRIATFILMLMIFVACFFVPVLAAIVVVFVVLAVWCFMSDSTKTRRF
jgi:U-box domain